MRNRDGRAYALAIAGVGTALVVMLIGASTIAALGHGVPKELWAIGGALSGALVGILVSSPQAKRGGEATPRAAGYKTYNAAVTAARNKVAEIQTSGVTPQELSAAEKALRTIEGMRGGVIAKLVAMAPAGAWRESGKGQEAAAAAVELQQETLGPLEQQLLFQEALAGGAAVPAGGVAGPVVGGPPPTVGELRAMVSVHQAAHSAASTAAESAGQRDTVWFAALRTITAEARIFVPLLLFTAALALGVLLGLGVIHAQPCPEEAKSCLYYAETTKQAANALIALASAAGGALLGVFATSPTDASAKAPKGA